MADTVVTLPWSVFPESVKPALCTGKVIRVSLPAPPNTRIPARKVTFVVKSFDRDGVTLVNHDLHGDRWVKSLLLLLMQDDEIIGTLSPKILET